MITITRRYRFCASHRLHSSSLSEAENQRIYGKCNNPYGHGHDFILDVGVTGEINATTGLVIRMGDLDRLVSSEILTQLDYRYLNSDVREFTALVPTTENLALVIAGRLREKWSEYFPYSSASVSGIYIQETERNGFEVLLSTTKPARIPAEISESVILNG